MTLKEFFANSRICIADGAMGTYFSSLTGKSSSECEEASFHTPDMIQKIHTDYIKAGARIIRTNTFSANTRTLACTREHLKKIIHSAYHSAQAAAQNQAVVCADISALYENTPDKNFDIFDEYQFIIHTFLSLEAKTFLFETVSDPDAVMPAINYLKKISPDSEIMLSFAILPDGRTRSGIPVQKLAEFVIQNAGMLTAAGLNCGCGAAQLFPHAVPFFTYIQENTDLFTMFIPNAGYPSIENQRTVFTSTPAYFAEQMKRYLPLKLHILGGCCGTSPEHISLLSSLAASPSENPEKKMIPYQDFRKTKKADFSSKLAGNDFLIAAELDPPNHTDLSKLLKAAKILKQSGVDIITVSDSPLGHAKLDSVICSARIKREVNIETLPHICCRDKNINALRSILMGAHTEGIRAVLAVTGDHITETDRGIIRPVFNMDSTKLMTMISQMNEDIFSHSPIAVGGAFDPDAVKPEFSLKRLEKKISCGAKFALTQPIFSERAISVLKEASKRNIKILVGIMPMISYRNAYFMQNEVPGINIPDELVKRFTPEMAKEESIETGIQIACELAERALPYAGGFYFMTPFNRAEIIAEIITRLKL